MGEVSPVDSQAYRRTMGLFPTGVSVLITEDENGDPIGMTANSLTSVSLNPLIILVCVQKTAHISPHILKAGWFAFSFLPEDRADLSNFFAGLWDENAPLPPFEFDSWATGLRLRGSSGDILCTPLEIVEGGDHWIVLGNVRAVRYSDHPAKPLVFYRGGYHRLQLSDSV